MHQFDKLYVDGAPPGFGPEDCGLAAWSMDPAVTAGSTAPTGAYVYLVQVRLRRAATLTRVLLFSNAGGTSLTAGQSFAGLYDMDGARVGTTADQSSAWLVAGAQDMPLQTAHAAAAGTYYVAFLSNSTGTHPAWQRGSSNLSGNAGLALGSYRFARTSATHTALPASVVLSGLTPTFGYWAAVG